MKGLLTVLGLLIGITAFSQDLVRSKKPTALFNNEQVKVSYVVEECKLPQLGIYKEYAYLKMENKTDKPVSLSWVLEKHYGDQCFGCNLGEEYVSRIKIAPHSSVEGGCKANSLKSLEAYVRHLNMPESEKLTKLNLNMISVK